MSNCSLTPQAHKEYIKLVNNYKIGLKMRNLTRMLKALMRMTFTCPTTMSNTVKQALLDQETSIVITSSISCTIEEFMS